MKASCASSNICENITAARKLLGEANSKIHDLWVSCHFEGSEMLLIQGLYENAQTSMRTLEDLFGECEYGLFDDDCI